MHTDSTIIRANHSRSRCCQVKPNEMKEFATQARRTLEKAQKYRDRAADETLDEIDRARLFAAARAIEINGREWTKVARQLAR